MTGVPILILTTVTDAQGNFVDNATIPAAGYAVHGSLHVDCTSSARAGVVTLDVSF